MDDLNVEGMLDRAERRSVQPSMTIPHLHTRARHQVPKLPRCTSGPPDGRGVYVKRDRRLVSPEHLYRALEHRKFRALRVDLEA